MNKPVNAGFVGCYFLFITVQDISASHSLYQLKTVYGQSCKEVVALSFVLVKTTIISNRKLRKYLLSNFEYVKKTSINSYVERVPESG